MDAFSLITKKRLQKDFRKINDDPPPGVSAELVGSNLYHWNAVIFGPGDTCWEGGCFRLRMIFPSNYPNQPPEVWFYSKMFHPNVYRDGRVCLDVLEIPEMWSPEYDAASILCAIQGVLGDPNPDSPANAEANLLFRVNKEEYERRVKEIVQLSERDKTDANLNAKKL